MVGQIEDLEKVEQMEDLQKDLMDYLMNTRDEFGMDIEMFLDGVGMNMCRNMMEGRYLYNLLKDGYSLVNQVVVYINEPKKCV